MKISVIIPAHNEEDVIKRSIDSVLSSKYKDYELIIVNDGSADRTKEVVESYMKKHKRIRLVNHKKPRGAGGARNAGARAAKGDVLFFLDADDWLVNNALLNTVALFKKHDPDAINYQREIIRPKNWKRLWLFKFKSDWGMKKGTYFSKELYCPYVFKKSVFKKLGGFRLDSFYFEDFLMVRKIHDEGYKVLVSNKIKTRVDLGASYNDFYKRARNIGRGVIISDVPGKKQRLVMQVLLSLLVFIHPLTFISYYTASFFYWLNRSRDLLLGFTSPILFLFEKVISFVFMVKEALS